MSTSAELSKNVRALAKQFSALTDIADYLEGVGSLEQLRAEAETQAAKAQGIRDAVLAEIEDARSRLPDAVAKIAVATSEATKTEDAAQQRASAIIDTATSDGQRIVGAANQRSSEIDAETATRKAVLAEVNQSVASARSELSTLTAQMSALRADAAKLLS